MGENERLSCNVAKMPEMKILQGIYGPPTVTSWEGGTSSSDDMLGLTEETAQKLSSTLAERENWVKAMADSMQEIVDRMNHKFGFPVVYIQGKSGQKYPKRKHIKPKFTL